MATRYPRLTTDERAEIASELMSLVDPGSEITDYEERIKVLANKVYPGASR